MKLLVALKINLVAVSYLGIDEIKSLFKKFKKGKKINRDTS
jgi:hypothetical protein